MNNLTLHTSHYSNGNKFGEVHYLGRKIHGMESSWYSYGNRMVIRQWKSDKENGVKVLFSASSYVC